MERAAGLLAFVLLMAMVATGCGGSGDDSNASSAPSTSGVETIRKLTTISKAEFVKQGNAACRKVRSELPKQIADFERSRAGKKPRTYADAAHFVLIPAYEAEVWGVEKLGAPPGDEERIDKMLAAERTAIGSIAVMPRVPSIKGAERHFTDAEKQFRAYGLTDCTKG